MPKKQKNRDEIRVRNPFLDPLVTELIEDPSLYRRMFSERILVGETLQVFQPVNAVLLGPQGSGKSMILNLIRYRVLSNWLSRNNKAIPSPLRHIEPFLGISMNLTRAGFHAFGRRSFAKALGRDDPERALDLSSAGDFLNQFLFKEFLMALQFLRSKDGQQFAEWLKIPIQEVTESKIAEEIASWNCWFGYYKDCKSLDEMLLKCEGRLDSWRRFLTTSIDEMPAEIWGTKTEIGVPLHSMGNLLTKLSKHRRLPLYVVLDQYEVLPELNKTHGTDLQRLANTLIKSRDPVVFFKLGARTYDWGSELRIWGSESRIEIQRDYVTVNLSDVLMRNEYAGTWIFPEFAKDVALRRIREVHYQIRSDQVSEIFGPWSANDESWLYFKNKTRRFILLRGLNKHLAARITNICGPD